MNGKKTHTHTHNRAIRPCHPSHSMPLALILPKGDQCVWVCVFVCCVYRKERSKRPHQSKRPGAQKIAKNGANAPGRIFFKIIIEKRPGYIANAPERSFSLFSKRKAQWGEPTTREGVRKGPAAEAERDASQHAVGGTARVYFSPHIYSSIQASFFYFFVSTSGLKITSPTFFFFLEMLGGRLLPHFCSEKRTGYVANAPAALFRNCFMERPEGRLLRSLRHVN